MEMSFPLLSNKASAPISRADFRALLSKAISRQANSPTARAMVKAMRDPQVHGKQLDALESRIQFFSGRHNLARTHSAILGSFFPHKNERSAFPRKNKQPVYQDGLANRKHNGISLDLSEMLANNPGQETLRTI